MSPSRDLPESDHDRVVVVGGGLAGTRLARRLAAHGAGDRTLLLGEEEHAPYNRVLLAEVLAGRYPAEVITLPEAAPHTVRRGVRAVRVDRDRRTVQCDDGSEVAYGTLVLATGGNAVLPPLRGLFPGDAHELPDGVFGFRTLDDCLGLDAWLDTRTAGARAVVVGGGLLGVSAARALAARGAEVLLAHQGEHLMDRHLDEQAASLVRNRLEALGVEVHTECRVRGVRTEGSPAAVRAVELADGARLEADLLVLACGVRPRTGLARAAGLEVADGIVVDDRLRTSDPHIHAIGDCAQHDGTVYGLAGPATEQADVLARVLTGDSRAVYDGSRLLTRLTLDGVLDLAAFGDTGPAAPGDHVLRLADATRGSYRKVVLRDDRLVGGILLGDLDTVGDLAHAWQRAEPLPDSPLHLLTTHGTTAPATTHGGER
jgi:assimilatory nitrate reductase electron transfer subunit